MYALLNGNGWAHQFPSVKFLDWLLQASQVKLVAIEDGEILGFLRGITDGLSNGYLSMVVVAPEKRRQGIGTLPVNAALGEHRQITWVLRARRNGAPEFFSQLGFVESSQAMERKRDWSRLGVARRTGEMYLFTETR